MKKILFTLLILSGGVAAQNRAIPDCILSFSISSAAAGPNLNNISQQATGQSIGGCSQWAVVSDTFNTGIGTIQFESSATSDAAGTSPTSFVAFAGTISSGSNPNSTFPWTLLATGYQPWVRVNVTAYTSGTFRGNIFGWREQTGGGGSSSVSVSNLLACQNKSNTLNRAAINFTTATTTQIIAASGSTSITICSLSLAASGTTNISLLYGTGSACGTGTTQITGTQPYQNILAIALDNEIPIPASQAFCVTSSSAVTIGGFLTYVQF